MFTCNMCTFICVLCCLFCVFVLFRLSVFILIGFACTNARTTATEWVDRGSTVVKVLCYKSEGRWFDPSWCHWIFH